MSGLNLWWSIGLYAAVATPLVAAVRCAAKIIILHMRIKELPTAIHGTESADRADVIRALLEEQPSRPNLEANPSNDVGKPSRSSSLADLVRELFGGWRRPPAGG
jgi:hypothetical protein